ncbi:MAG: glycosyltransferase, partial [Patescibacteria group bacterium]|nr:glycosyltransferase [Patescibacteria group bacterium]
CLNEVGNLAGIVTAIQSQSIPSLHILIVVDKSTDGTEKIAAKLQRQYPRQITAWQHPGPSSRAIAGKDAFSYCLNHQADVIIEMDADFSHHPKYIPIMLQELSKPGVDVVLGSRFLPGASDSDRSAFRTFVSRLSGIVFRIILGIKLTDMGSGFKAYKRQALASINPQQLYSRKGLAISMESIFRVIKNNFTVKEIPIVFKDRQVGESKLSWKDFFEPIIVCLKLVLNLGRYYEK